MPDAINFSYLSTILSTLGFKWGIGGANSTIGTILSDLLPYLFLVAGMLVLLYLLYGGITLMVSQGDPKKVESAKAKITGALIGFVIIFVSFWVIQIIGRILGIQAITNIFG